MNPTDYKFNKKYPLSKIHEALEKTPFHEHIVSFLTEYKEQSLIVTGNLDCWIKPLVKKIPCKTISSTSICTNDILEKVVHIIDKSKIVQEYQEKGYFVIFVGEGHNDAEAIRSADIGIAFGKVHYPSNSVMQVASHAIFDEEELCRFLKQLL